MEKLSEAASRVVIARPRRGRGNLGKALPEWERHRRPYTPPDLTVAAFPAQPLAALPPYGCAVSAATDAIGAHHFNDSLYELHCLPEIATSAYGLLAMTSRGLSPF